MPYVANLINKSNSKILRNKHCIGPLNAITLIKPFAYSRENVSMNA